MPAAANAFSVPIPIAAFKEAPNDGPGWHRVRRGESLASIAERYGLTSSELKQLNGLSSNAVSSGKKLRLHEGASFGGKKSVKSVSKKKNVKPVRRR